MFLTLRRGAPENHVLSRVFVWRHSSSASQSATKDFIVTFHISSYRKYLNHIVWIQTSLLSAALEQPWVSVNAFWMILESLLLAEFSYLESALRSRIAWCHAQSPLSAMFLKNGFFFSVRKRALLHSAQFWHTHSCCSSSHTSHRAIKTTHSSNAPHIHA